MEHLEEKKDLIRRLHAQDEGIGNILSLRGYSLISEDVKSELLSLQKETQTIIRKLEKNEFEIAVVGLEKAGKSSFCNALIENNMLPTDEARCTYTSTCIISSDVNKVEIKFYTKQEFERDFREKLAKLGIENADKYTLSGMSEGKYDELYETVNPEKQRLYDATINQEIRDIIQYKSQLQDSLGREPKIFEGEALDSGEFKEYIVKPYRAMAVKEVIISSALLDKMPNAIIYDVPGFNSPTEMHRIQTKNKMDSADAIIMVANADAPSITADLLKIFKESDSDGTVLAEKLFVFENKADRANKLQDNIGTIYNEWGARHKILYDTSRFFFGSSNARLQSLNKLDSDNTTDYKTSMNNNFSKLSADYSEIKNFASEENGFGIVAMRKALEAYNETERFRVIQKRIGRLHEELIKKLTELAEKTANDGDENYSTLDSTTRMKFHRDFKDKFVSMLNSYQSEHRKDMNSQKPLSHDLASFIEKSVIPENYKEIIAEERKKAENSLDTISSDTTGSMNISGIENDVRKRIFTKMYIEDFYDKTAGIVSKFHSESEQKILDMFMEALGVKSSSKQYNRIKEDVRAELARLTNSDSSPNYYRSLIDRYSRNLYELLIKEHYSDERYTKFYAEMSTLFSMSVYYDNTIEPTANSKLDNITDKSLKNNVFCYQILCHDYTCSRVAEAEKEAANKAIALLRVDKLPQNILPLISSIVRKDILGAVSVISDVVAAVADDPDADNRTVNAKIRLQQTLDTKYRDSANLFDADITNREEFMPIYRKCFNPLRTYDDMVNDLNDDIRILNDALLHCFIRALALEKPYLTKEAVIIDNIKSSLDSDEFINFITALIPQILENEYEEINSRRQERELNAICSKQIKAVMETMRDVITA